MNRRAVWAWIAPALVAASASAAEPAPGAAPPPAAPGGERRAVEDELFGGDDPAPSSPTPEAAPSAAPAAAAKPDDALPMRKSFELRRDGGSDQTLSIGGQFFPRVQALFFDTKKIADTPVSSSNLLDLYIDGRPVDRLRVYTRGRLIYDPTVRSTAATTTSPQVPGQTGGLSIVSTSRQTLSFVLDQLWIKFDAGRVAYITFGRQRIRWGAARFWNPTDFLVPVRRDPLTIFDARAGIGLLKVHFPVESKGFNFYVLGLLDGFDRIGRPGAAARAEFQLGDRAELTLSAAARHDEPYRFGADISAGVGDVDFYVEAALLYDVRAPFYRGNLVLDAANPTFPTAYSRRNEPIPQVSAGFDWAVRYGDNDVLSLGAEYFYNGAGYDRANLYPWLAVNGRFNPLFTGRHYAGVFALLNAPGTWNLSTFILSALANLSDRSGLLRLDFRQQVLQLLNLNAFVGWHFGETGGEFRFAARIPPIPGVLPGGLSIRPPLIDVGVGAVLAF